MAEQWTVLGQEQTIAKLPDDTFGPVVRVKFRTAGGVVRSIDVPTAQYTPDNVRSMIDAEAQATDDIANL